MRRVHLCLIPLLAIAAVWIHYANYKALRDLPKPFFAALDSLQAENLLLQHDLDARQQEIATLNAQITTLTAQLQTQTQPVPTATRRRSSDDGADSARPQLISMQANSDPWGADLAQPAAQAQTLQFATNTTTSNDYWQQIQEISSKYIVGRDDKTKFLQEGSRLIQKLQEAQQSLQIDLESVQFLEVKANDEGIDGILKLTEAKKKMTEQATLIAQYQRDL
jgi:hypothetical protein